MILYIINTYMTVQLILSTQCELTDQPPLDDGRTVYV